MPYPPASRELADVDHGGTLAGWGRLSGGGGMPPLAGPRTSDLAALRSRAPAARPSGAGAAGPAAGRRVRGVTLNRGLGNVAALSERAERLARAVDVVADGVADTAALLSPRTRVLQVGLRRGGAGVGSGVWKGERVGPGGLVLGMGAGRAAGVLLVSAPTFAVTPQMEPASGSDPDMGPRLSAGGAECA
jgi:hypothetical protein